MSRPKLLDLFSCEGGAARGYDLAGFDVYGVDLDPKFQKRYPYPFYAGDAVAVLRHLIAGGSIGFATKDGRTVDLRLGDFSAVHASPPCQAYSITKHSHGKAHPELIEPTRDALDASGLPYAVENVVGAPLLNPVTLCWSMFRAPGSVLDLDGTPLRMERHRLFESNINLTTPTWHSHDKSVQVAGAYGGGSADRSHAKFVRRGGYTPSKEVRAALLEIDWMTLHGLSQSIPPFYSEWVGLQLRQHVIAEQVAA